MANYRHTQKGSLIVGILLSSAIFMLAIAAFAQERTVVAMLIVASCVMIVASWLFSSLTVEGQRERTAMALRTGILEEED